MKLRKLIVSGFKSFADKTEFEFDDGISCIVGPNGCGKSNVVDAVKWVLGEQSAKSLRGSEMMDVIFNGSSSRKSAGGASVTLVFNNSEGLLRPKINGDTEPSEVVSVTRRLFRSGQSDYLINKVHCRLRDVREMFMDTGNAYSLIEQGRVEAFLQASQEERRAIFDEAAGINKYKARKKEALRKLERVEQNLLRINDILGEVEKRLRSIKYQAGKARNYQKHSERLKELRSLYFLSQYHTQWVKRSALQKRLDASIDALSHITARIGQLESAQSAAEVESVDLERTARDLQGRSAALGGQISAQHERSEMLTKRIEELGEQAILTSRRCEEIEAKIERIEEELVSKRSEMSKVEATAIAFQKKHEESAAEHGKEQAEIARLQSQLDDAKAGTIDLLRRTAELHNEIHGLSIRKENLKARRDRLDERTGQIEARMEDLASERAAMQSRLDDASNVLSDAREKLDAARNEAVSLKEDEQSTRRKAAQLREQRSALTSRIETLREMHRKREGLSAGVQRVLAAREEGKLSFVRGLLPEVLQTDVEHALVIEAALSGSDQQLLVDRLSDVEAHIDELRRAIGEDGAVEVLCLDQAEGLQEDSEKPQCPNVIARAADWVRAPRWADVAVRRVLGNTLVVSDLPDAFATSRALGGGFRFVTLAGDVLESDGRLRIGAANRTSGIVTRGSELRDLRTRRERIDRQIEDLDTRARSLEGELTRLENLQQKLRTVIYEANTERIESQTRTAQLDRELEGLRTEAPLVAADRENMIAEMESAVEAEREAEKSASELERRAAERQAEVDRTDLQITAATRRRDELSGEMTELRIALGRAEEKKRSIEDSIAGLTAQREQMDRDLTEGRSQIELDRKRRSDAERQLAESARQIDRLYAQHEKLEIESKETHQTQRTIAERLEQTRTELSERRKAHEDATSEVNTHRIELSEVDVRIENLITRASEEMQMDLLELYKTYEHDEERDWDAVETEIGELRGKIERLGNINLDAIAEQDELEKRRGFLIEQLEDVKSTQNQLAELIRRINRQSRQMFTETFSAVRENFQQLFRKLFGGGRADIFLTDPEDVLESGIEILARPPGKELRTLSLLSGGEKTMTALALLFSIFRAKPSPFCLLDEVDAALDEPNTERFSRLLREFNDKSQFVIISHAKRTIGMANVLYGVTMGEPGVSKRISVRFEEVDRALEHQYQPAGT